jgi:hypothetical protein
VGWSRDLIREHELGIGQRSRAALVKGRNDYVDSHRALNNRLAMLSLE